MKSRPWAKSTGPRTAEGKAKAAGHSRKHGARSWEAAALMAALAELLAE